MTNTNGIGITELINEIKRELRSLEADNQENVPLFSVDKVELELQVTVNKEASAGLSIQVIKLGGGVEQQDVQKVKVTLSPLLEKEARLQHYKSQQPEMWQKLQDAQIQATIKGSGQSSQDDFYG